MSKKMWKKLSTLLLMVVMVLTMSLSVQAAAVKMNKAKATLYPGQKVTLKVTGTSKKAKWSSSNAKVAKVSKGKVTAVKKGKATIKAKVGKKTYTCLFTCDHTFFGNSRNFLITAGYRFDLCSIQLYSCF